MYYVLPISNLYIENVIKLGDSYLIPQAYFNQYQQEELDFDTAISKKEKTLIHDVMEICIYDYSHFMSVPCLIMCYPDSDIIQNTVAINDMFHLDKICLKADEYLDMLRVYECNPLNKETLPGHPGLVPADTGSITKMGMAVDLKKDEYRSLAGSVVSFYTEYGIGLCPNMESPAHQNPDEYEYFFSTRTDEVYLSCRSAFRRISESMYMDNLNVSFIYLMSTLEMLASPEYINFDKVKSKILPFICDAKEAYHEWSYTLRTWSQEYRTQVVHNGKSIYDILDSQNAIKKCLYPCAAPLASIVPLFWIRESPHLIHWTWNVLIDKKRLG